MNRPAPAHFAYQGMLPCKLLELRSKHYTDTRCTLLQPFLFQHIEYSEPHRTRHGVAARGAKEFTFFHE